MRTLLVLLLWTAGLVAAAQFAKVSVILPELRLLYPAAGAGLGWLVSLISAMGVALGLFAGVLAGRAGPRRLLLGSLALGALASFAQSALIHALPGELAPLLVTRVVEGLSHLGIVVAAPTLIARIAPDGRRGLAMTLWGTFFGVAFALVALVAPSLVAWHGVGGLFAWHGGAAALTALALLALPPDGAGEPAERFTLLALWQRHRAAYASPAVAAPAIGWLFYTLTFVSLLAVLPGLVEPQWRATVATLAPLASIASSMTLGLALLRVTGAVGVVLIGFALAGVVALMLPVWPGNPALAIALFAALGLVQGASFAAVPELNGGENERALANGALAQTGNTGNLLGTPLLLAVLAAGGLPLMAGVVATCYAAGFLAHIVLARRRALAAA